MREIKFRAWDEERFKMVDGTDIEEFIQPYFEECEHVCDMQRYFTGMSYGNLFVAYYNKQDDWTNCELMQFIGLLDKNGKEIYEGDVCRFDAVEIDGFDCFICDLVGEVKWDGDDTGFYYLTNSDRFPHVKPWFAKNIEIIGNIYENPELLEATP